MSFVVNLSNVFLIQLQIFFLKLLVTISVAPFIARIIVHFRFHIRCISIHKLLYFNFFSASFCTTFLSAGIATSISVQIFSFWFLISIPGLLLSLLLLLILLLLLYDMDVSCHRHFFPVLLLNQQ